MKVLVLVANYPNNDGGVTLMYVHTRNKYYSQNGIGVTVLNFAAKNDYIYDGIQVITLSSYIQNANKNYNILISHAANLRNHYRFLTKYEQNFKKLIFFFHGHEVLNINKVYSRPFPYIKKNYFRFLIQNIYDNFKLKTWRKYYTKVAPKAHYIFVSKWMYDEFIKWTKISTKDLEDRHDITYNCVGKQFEEANYEWNSTKKYDFVTIRNNLDGSKYSIDIVNDLAHNNPQYNFLVVGKGRFFSYYPKAKNLTWIDKNLNHSEIIDCLKEARCALMPTRTDAQGLMMCEMATVGIPLITSDIPVCHETFNGWKNVGFIDNENKRLDLSEIFNLLQAEGPYIKNDKYFNRNTSAKEVQIINLVGNGTNEN